MSETRLSLTFIGAVTIIGFMALCFLFFTALVLYVTVGISGLALLALIGAAIRKWQQSGLSVHESKREYRRLALAEAESEHARQLARERHDQELQLEQQRHEHELDLARLEFQLKQYVMLTRIPVEQYGTVLIGQDEASLTHLAPVYKPTPQLKAGDSPLAMPTQAQAGQALIVPARYDLREVWRAFTPAKEQIFLGRSAQGDIVVPANKLLHCALTGPTGGGKTSILRMILMQLIYIGAQVTLCDLHYAPIKYSETGEPIDWRPIVKRLAQPPIRDIETIARWMQWLAFTELQARIDRQYAGQPIGRPIFFTIEELPAVLDEAREEIGRPLAKILRQGRQYGIYFIGASQDLLTNTLKMSSGPRECFRTGYYTGGDPTTARALLDLPNGVKLDEDGLGIEGQVYLKTALHPAVLTRVGWASNEALYDLFRVPTSDRLGNTIVDADMPENRPGTARNTDVWTSPQSLAGEPVDTAQATSDARLKQYRLTDVEITAFVAAYKACGSIDRALATIEKGSSYRDHARDLVKLHALRKEA